MENEYKFRTLIKYFLLYSTILIIFPFVNAEQSETIKDTIVNIELYENLSIDYKYVVRYCAIGEKGFYNKNLNSEFIDPFLSEGFQFNKTINLTANYGLLNESECLELNVNHQSAKALHILSDLGTNYETIYFRHPFYSLEGFPLNQSIQVNIKLPYSFYDYVENKQLILISAPYENRFFYDKDLTFNMLRNENSSIEMTFYKNLHKESLAILVEFFLVLKENEPSVVIEHSDTLEFPAKKITQTISVKNNYKNRAIYYGTKNVLDKGLIKAYILGDKTQTGTFFDIKKIEPDQNELIPSLSKESYFNELQNCGFSILEKIGYPFECKILTGQNNIASDFELNGTPFNVYFDYKFNLDLTENFVIDVDNYKACVFPKDVFYPLMPFYSGTTYYEQNGTYFDNITFNLLQPQIFSWEYWDCDSEILEPGAGVYWSYTGESDLVNADNYGSYFYVPIYKNNKILLNRTGNSWRSDNKFFQLSVPYSSYHAQYYIIIKRDLWFSIIIPLAYAIIVPIATFYLRRHPSLRNKNRGLYYLYSFLSIFLAWIGIYNFLGNPPDLFLWDKSLWLMITIMLMIFYKDR